MKHSEGDTGGMYFPWLLSFNDMTTRCFKYWMYVVSHEINNYKNMYYKYNAFLTYTTRYW